MGKDDISKGLQIFLYGLVKKVLIGDRLGYYVDTVFAIVYLAPATNNTFIYFQF